MDSMPLGQVAAYVQELRGMRVSRQTVYNWTVRGRNGAKLRVETKHGQKYTTPRWIQEFFNDAGL